MAISKQQSMRPAEIELIDASNQHESTLQAHAQSLDTLGKNLSAETADRKSADTALGTRIDNEVKARTDADTALGTRIDNEVKARTDADTAEVQARTDADTALGTRIDNEVKARTGSDANLQGQIDALVAIGAEPNVIDSISVNGAAQPVTGKNVNITASSVVDGNAIAPSSVSATGNVSDSVGSLADLRDSVSRVKFVTANSVRFTRYESPARVEIHIGFDGSSVGIAIHDDGTIWIIKDGQIARTI